jgi:hypothetical protein
MMRVGTFSDDMMTTRLSLSAIDSLTRLSCSYPVIPGTTAFLLLLAFGAGDDATDAGAAAAVAMRPSQRRTGQTSLPSGLGCATAVRPLRERRRRLRTCLGSVAVARSWWSAVVGRLPRGGTAAGPQDHRRSHARENRRRR